MNPALILAIFGAAFYSAFAGDITFTNRTVTFTDLQGRAYRRVELVRADRDGLIWRDGASGGRICYTNLDVGLLESLGIPTNRIEVARTRAEQKAVADARYRSAVFPKTGLKAQQGEATNSVASLYVPNPTVADYPRVPFDPGYAYPPQYIYGYGVPTVAPLAPSAMSSPTAATAINASSTSTAARSSSGGNAPSVIAVPSSSTAFSAPSAPPAGPPRRR